MLKSHLQLQPTDRALLQALVRKETVSAKVFKRATALLALDQGATLQQAAANVHSNYNTVAAWRDSYHQGGLTALQDKPRSGRPIQMDGTQRAQLTALACTTPPAGHARWSLRLLADKVVELGYLDAISHTQVGEILKKTNSNLISKRLGVSPNSIATS